ncbi:MAG: protein kinase, partial [Cyanobacteria bacterium]|nr:protein kinase [Cyanobacteriota bacterium]
KATKIIMLTSHDADDVIYSALSSGASGYCSKDIDTGRLCEAIKAVSRGDVWLDAAIADKVLKLCSRQDDKIQQDLSNSQVSTFTDSERHLVNRLLNPESQHPIAEEFDHASTVAKTKIMNALRKVEHAANAKFSLGFGQQTRTDGLMDKYEFLAMLGRGGMSYVYKARHRLLDKIFAVKFLSFDLRDKSFTERFKNEAQMMSLLSHPNIISLHDFGFMPDGQPYIVMDYADGLTLDSVIEQAKRLTGSEALDLFTQISEALGYAHERNLVHRDVKPANILVCEDNGKMIVKLLDFGLAKNVVDDNCSQRLTQSGQVIGSPLYMSPEQCLGQTVDTRSDVYSLGCLMYECLRGEPPFYGKNALDTMAMHIISEPPVLEPAEHPSDLCNIINRCLKKDPSDRFANAGEIHRALLMLSGKDF